MKVIVSRNPLAIKQEMFARIKEDLKNKRQVYLIVPEQSTLSTELDVFEYYDFESTIDLKVKSFRSIINEILLKEGGLKLDYLSEFSQKLLLKMAINEVRDQIKVYDKSLKEDGFAKLILDFIKVIKSNLISPDQFREINDQASYSQTLKDKMADVSLIYAAYQRLVSKSSYDGHDRVDLAISKIPKMKDYQNISFYIDQFSNMSKQEIELITQLDQISNNLCLNITMDPRLIPSLDSQVPSEVVIDDGAVFEVSRRFLRALGHGGLSFIEVKDDSHVNPQIDYLLKKIFSYKKPEKLDEDQALDQIFIKRYKNSDEETEALAINIAKDIFEKNLSYKDIAVVVTDQAEYYDKIKRQFKLNNLSFFMDSHRDLLENPIAKYIKSAIALLGSNFSYEFIVSYMKQAFFSIDQYKLNIFQNFLAQRRIVGDMIFKDKYFEFDQKKLRKDDRYKEEDELNFEIANEVRNIFLESISEFEEDFEHDDRKDSMLAWSKRIYEFISLDAALERIGTYEEELKGLDKAEILEENRLIWNKFMEILDDFSKVDSEYSISFEDFSKYLEDALGDIKIGIVPPSKDQIQIGDLDRSRFSKVKKIYVVGFTNRYFPKSHNSPDILIEEEKEDLIDAGIDIENTNKKYADKDIFALYNAISKASDQLVFSYSLVNSSNEAMEEASILKYIQVLVKKKNIDLFGGSYLDNIYSKTRLSHYLPTLYRRIANKQELDKSEKNFVLSLVAALQTKKDYQTIYNSIALSDKMLVKKDRLSDKALAFAFPEEARLSVSQIENYVQCPYKHYISYGLKPREDSTFNMDAMSFGNIAHKSVDSFIKKHAREDFESQDQVEEALLDDFEEARDENISSYQLEDPRNRYYIKNLRAMLSVSCFALSEQYKLMDPDETLTEAYYGHGPFARFPALSYQVDGKTYDLSGIIDRVDVYELDGKKYYRVIDYKTGNKYFDLLKVFYGLDIQLMVYLYTVTKLEESKPLGAFYMKLNHRYRQMGQDEDLDQLIMDKHLLDGLATDDLSILMKSDKSFSPDSIPNSLVVKLARNKKDYLKQDAIISEDQFDSVFKRVNSLVEDNIHKIKTGQIQVEPYKLKKKIPCEYCAYRSICKFGYNKYRNLEPMSKEEIFENLGGSHE